MLSMQKILVIGVVAVVAIAGAAIGIVAINNKDSGSSGELTLTVGTLDKVTGTNLSAANSRYMVQDIMYLPLINWNYGVANPCLATSWTTDDGCKSYTVTLRDDVEWSDGDKFDADDVVLSINNQMASSKTKYSGVEKIDDYKVKITMGFVNGTDASAGIRPNANWPAENTNLQIYPYHIFKDVALGKFGTVEFPTYCVATGPMVISGIDKDAGTITYEANDSYFGGKPSVRTLVMKTYSNNEALMMAVMKGEVDTTYTYTTMGMDTNYLSKVLDSGLSLKTVKSAGLGPTVWFNSDTAVGADKDVRLACRYAINYEEIISYLANGVGEVPNTGVWTPRGAYFKETAKMTYDPDEAASILDAAGWTIKGSDTYRTNDSSEVLQIDMFSRSAEASCVKAMQFIAEYFEAVGIKTSTTVGDSMNEYLKAEPDGHHSKYEACVYIWTSGAMDSNYGYLTAPLLSSKMMGAAIGSDATVMSLVDTLAATPIAERATIAGQIQDYWSENAPMVPTYWYSYLVPYKSNLTGLCDHSTYGIICVDTMMNLQLKG